jgi:hypothetical protein
VAIPEDKENYKISKKYYLRAKNKKNVLPVYWIESKIKALK